MTPTRPPRSIVVTCGPAAAPIDHVRRLTNLSTGELGARLANALTAAGHRVFCCRGAGATFPGPIRAHALLPFLTNQDLARLLAHLGQHEPIHAVFHAAALCDFQVARILDASGQPCRQQKIPSRQSALHLILKPAPKLLPTLHRTFPHARIVGWKYESDGTPNDAIAAAQRQLKSCRTAATIANGPALGPGFAFCTPDGDVRTFPHRAALVRFLVRWLDASERPGGSR